jgi:hypothetical protein
MNAGAQPMIPFMPKEIIAPPTNTHTRVGVRTTV